MLAVIGMVASLYYYYEGEAGASDDVPWEIVEMPVAVSPGDQVSPAVSDSRVVFNDTGRSADGWVVMKDVYGGDESAVYGPGVSAGPDIDGVFIAWQDADSRVCRRSLADGTESCVASTPAAELTLSSGTAVTGENGGSTISRINFQTGRSKKIDSYSRPGMRFDPDIDGTQAVWVRMRGYGTRYYEPLLVSYDVSDDSWSYLSQVGGGASTSGESLYQRSKPSIDNGRVLYQQRLNEPGETWDIYQAEPDTAGLPVVQEPGDQVNPALADNILVYQDNRDGHFDEAGRWVGEWDLYVRNLDTGEERLLCGAPGDQVNPDIDGDIVVWQDNRNGDWDVYAAVLSPPEVGSAQPNLTLSVGPVFWDSYADYTARELSVSYRVANRGEGAGLDVALRQVVVRPATVAVAGDLPASAARLSVGQTGLFPVKYHVPPEVSRFRTDIYASCKDEEGNELWFPGPPPSM